MSSFLKSRRSRILTTLLILFLSLLFIERLISRKLYESKNKIEDYLSKSIGYSVTLDDVTFSFIKGIHLKGLSIFYDKHRRSVMNFKGVSISLNPILSLLKDGIVLDRINLSESELLLKKEAEGLLPQVIFSDLRKGLSRSRPGRKGLAIYTDNLIINAGVVKIIPVDNEYNPGPVTLCLKNMSLSLRADGKVRGKGDTSINYRLPEKNSILKNLSAKLIEHDLKYSLEARINNNNLEINNITLWLENEQIIGSGVIRDFAERKPYMDIWLILPIFALEDVAFINKNFAAQGFISASVIINGPMENTKVLFKGSAYDCNLEYPLAQEETLSLKNIRGVIEFKEPFLNLKNMFLKIYNLPLNLNLKIDLKEQAFSLDVSLTKYFLETQNLPLQDLGAVFNGQLGNVISGELEINATYIRPEEEYKINTKFKGLEFDYLSQEQKYLKTDGLEFTISGIGQEQRLDFVNLKSKVELGKNRISIKDIALKGYGGLFNGYFDIGLKDKSSLSFFLRGRELDIAKLMQDLRLTGKFLSGKLDTKIRFDNHSKEYLKGDCYVSQGLIDLSALAETVKMPPLENIGFETAHIYFTLSKDIARIRAIKLLSPDIKLNAYWDIIKKAISGILNIKISSGLLANSPQFKKLISLSGITSPYIDFRFLLGGIPKRIRLMWMKGEFKERLKRGSPEWVKRRVETGLDKMVDELSNK